MVVQKGTWQRVVNASVSAVEWQSLWVRVRALDARYGAAMCRYCLSPT